MRRHFIICLFLAGVTIGLYWPVRHYDLVYYDDPTFLLDSPEIQSGLNGQSFLWSFSSVILGNWHPVTTLSFVLDHQFFGTNPGAEHMVNVLFHTANVVLLYLLLNGLTRSRWRSVLVAAVFAWHPLRVESVAWITERKDVLSGFFFLLTLWFYARYARGRGAGSTEHGAGSNDPPAFYASRPTLQASRFYWLALGCFALGLMSKSMLVTLPFVLLLLDVWPLKRWASPGGVAPSSSPPVPPVRSTRTGTAREPAAGDGRATLRRLLWEKGPFFMMAGVFSVVTFIVQKNAGAVNSLTHLGASYRLANAITNYARYLGKLAWPVDLAVVYPYVRIDDWLTTGLIALALAGMSVFCWWQLRRRPWLAVGWFWYLGTSLPIIGLVQIGEAAMCDRYTYLTLLGPVIALVWLVPDSWAQEPGRKVWLGLGSAAILGTLVILTRQQILWWHDSVSLFAHTVAVTQNNPGAESGLAIGLEHEKRFAESLAHFRTAQMLNPEDPDNYLKSGYLLMQQNQWAGAADDLTTAARLAPNSLLAQEYLGTVLPRLGRADEGKTHWEAALKIAPNSPEVLNNLAWLLATSPDATVRDGPQAVQLAKHACELTRYKKTVFMGTLAAACAEAGQFGDAIAAAQKACAQASTDGEAALLRRNQELLGLYEKHQAYHEPADSPIPARN